MLCSLLGMYCLARIADVQITTTSSTLYVILKTTARRTPTYFFFNTHIAFSEDEHSMQHLPASVLSLSERKGPDHKFVKYFIGGLVLVVYT